MAKRFLGLIAKLYSVLWTSADLFIIVLIYMHDEPRAGFWLLIMVALITLSGAIFYFGRKNIETVGPLPSLSPTTSRSPRTYTVSYKSGVFSPTNIRIHVGDTVQFRNESVSLLSIVSNDVNGVLVLPGFETGKSIPPGGIFTFVFNQAGIFGYHNDIKVAEQGAVTVRP